MTRFLKISIWAQIPSEITIPDQLDGEDKNRLTRFELGSYSLFGAEWELEKYLVHCPA